MAADVLAGLRFAAGEWGQGGHDGVGFYTGGSLGLGDAVLTGTAAAFGDPVQAEIGGRTLALSAYGEVPGGIVLTTPDFASFYVFVAGGFDPARQYPLAYEFGGFAAPCFAAGTRIATARGETPVEALRLGDLIALHGGGCAPAIWIGRRVVDGGRGADAWPVRIAAHAFAPGQPRRPLLLSPDHAVLWQGGLIPARHLLNGATLTQPPAARVEYWHVELPAHAVLHAEGLPVESYLDTGNRAQFGGPGRSASPAEALRIWRARGCAPLRLDPDSHAGARRHLLDRARALGHALTDDPGLSLRCDGASLAAARDGARWRADLPPGARALRLRSRSATPAHLLPDSRDHRRLGVALAALSQDGAPVPPERFLRGWHAPEPGLRWTDGDAELACDGARGVEFRLLPLLAYWRRG